MTILSETQIERRKPVWTALSDLWLDTELSDRGLSHIAGVLDASGFTLAQLQRIYLYKVAPDVFLNFWSVAGVWDCFDEEWLHEEIVHGLDRRTGLGAWWIKAWRRAMTFAARMIDWAPRGLTPM